MSVPAYWEKLAKRHGQRTIPDAQQREAPRRRDGRQRLRFCLSGGAGLKREVKETFFTPAGCSSSRATASPSASPTLTLNRPDAFRFDSVGKPCPSVELRLAEDGEILAKGPERLPRLPQRPRGHAPRPSPRTAGFSRPATSGRFTDDGFLQIVDRKKDILVTAGGKNVPPANIELRFATTRCSPTSWSTATASGTSSRACG
jgi:long-chain acyl-CoA synthetase